MFGKMKDMMEMKKQADQIKKQLDAEIVENEKIRGIKITINGAQKFTGIEIDDGLIDVSNKSRLQSDLLRALNSAIKDSQKIAQEKMKDVMPGF